MSKKLNKGQSIQESDIIDNNTGLIGNIDSDDFDVDFDDDEEIDFGGEPDSESESEPDNEQNNESDSESGSTEETHIAVEEKTSTEKKEETNNTDNKPNLILYIITDKQIPGLLSYFRSYGVQVSRIFTRIDNLVDEEDNIVEEGAKDTVIMQVEPSRLVVIDTGTGRFTNMGTRKALIDLIGISDSGTKVSIFYTDSVIESEITGSLDVDIKKIDWYKYRSTADVVANILKKTETENYVLDMEDNEELTNSKDILNIQGFRVDDSNNVDLGLATISVEDISVHRCEGAKGLIDGYAIKY